MQGEHIGSRELGAMASRIRIVPDKYYRSASETHIHIGVFE